MRTTILGRSDAQSAKQEHGGGRRLLRAWTRGAMAHVVVFALILTSLALPVNAKFKDLSGTLPGTGMSGVEKAGIIGAGAAITAVVVLLIVKHKRAKNKAKLSAPTSPSQKDNPVEPGKLSLAASSPISTPGTLKAAAVEGAPSAMATPDLAQAPLALAPGQVCSHCSGR